MSPSTRAISLAAATAVFVGAAMAPALAKIRVIYVDSDLSNKNVGAPIRLVSRNGKHPYWQFADVDGSWERCFQDCHEAYRKEVLDFWEESVDGKDGDRR